MLNNGNKKIFMEKYGLKNTKACIFINRLKNRHDQHKVFKGSFYYTLYDEIQDTTKVIDHMSSFYSKEHNCYITTAQPYWFYENLEEIRKIWANHRLEIKILKELSWHNPGSCTLYAIGTKENIFKIFGEDCEF